MVSLMNIIIEDVSGEVCSLWCHGLQVLHHADDAAVHEVRVRESEGGSEV